MSRRVQRVRVHLDPGPIRSLPLEEIRAILRGADDLIMRGGRSLLVKILRGSRSKDVIEKSLEQSPAYGYYADHSNEDVLARIDWLIENGYLDYEYDHRLPLLVFTPRGWAIEKNTLVEEHFQSCTFLLRADAQSLDMSWLKDKNREVIWLLLDRIEATGDARFIPLLQAWWEIDYKKVKQRIRAVIQRLNRPTAI